MRETLKVFAEAKKGLTGWQDISLKVEQVRICMQLFVNESSRWVERFYFQNECVLISVEIIVVRMLHLASRWRRTYGYHYLMHLDGSSKHRQLHNLQVYLLKKCYHF